MNGETNAKNSGAGTPKDKRNLIYGAGGLGCAGGHGESLGYDQDAISHPDSQGADCAREDLDKSHPEGDFGKILSQLREIEQSHLAYVGAHKKRLENRLNDAEEHERKFISQVEAVEQQILNLMDSLQQ